MSLASVSDAKDELGIAAAITTYDARLARLLDQASAAIESYCKRTFAAASRFEYYSGDDSQVLILRNTPVQSIANLWLDSTGYFGDGASAFASATLLVAGTDYALARDNASDDETSRSGIVRRLNGTWPAIQEQQAGMITRTRGAGHGNIKVEYTSGYGTIPGDVSLACLTMVRDIFGGHVGMQQESYEDYSYTRLAAAEQAKMIGSVASLLAPHKKWVL
jgi:hypothetical protein